MVEVYFEVQTIKALVSEIARLLRADPDRSRYGYCLIQHFAEPDFTLGTIDRLDVPGGIVANWEVPTLICCDEVITSMPALYVVLDHVLDGKRIALETSARPGRQYLSFHCGKTN
jgi:hypothetical protein